MKKLAVVIPAYKIDFFEETLMSFAEQSSKDFTLYIGIDASKSNFEELICKYKDKIDIKYYRFQENMGGKDLVAHWKRCIELTEGEEWLWLFSDDDVVGKDCVKLFLDEVSKENNYDIYHFDVKQINEQSIVIKDKQAFPEVFETKDFFKAKMRGRIDSFVVEYIFTRKVYESIGGFARYDMAWGSDTATWVKMGKERGIKTIGGEYVYWRKSSVNITPNKSIDVLKRKMKCDIDMMVDINKMYDGNMSAFIKYAIFLLFVYSSDVMPYHSMKEMMKYAKHKKAIPMWEFCIMNTVFYPVSMITKIQHKIRHI